MNENGNLKEMMKKMKERENCVESEEIHQINLIVFLFSSLSDDL